MNISSYSSFFALFSLFCSAFFKLSAEFTVIEDAEGVDIWVVSIVDGCEAGTGVVGATSGTVCMGACAGVATGKGCCAGTIGIWSTATILSMTSWLVKVSMPKSLIVPCLIK